MNLVALMPARNEDWVLGLSARAALLWCDSLVILDHASTDCTAAILGDLKAEYGARVVLGREIGDTWNEMEHRQALLSMARREGATHIAIVDADEILTGNLLPSIRKIIETMPRGFIFQLPGFNLRGAMNRYHANGIWGNRWFSIAFGDDPRLHWKGDQFHHREPFGPALSLWHPVNHQQGGIMHLWGLSERRLIAKHAAYKMTEALRWPAKRREEIDRMYSQAFDPSANYRFEQRWSFAAAPESWWEPYQSLLPHLHADAEPWQEKMCRELYAKHGAARFAGLNLFGVCEAAEVLA